MAITAPQWSASFASPTNGTTAVSLTLPATVKGGDVALLRLAWNNGGTGTTCTAPAGWTLIDSSSAGSASFASYFKVCAGAVGAASSDAGTTVTATLSTAKAWAASVDGYPGVNTANPIHSHAVRTESTSGVNHDTPAVTVSIGGAWIVSTIVERAATTTFTPPAGFVPRSFVSNVGQAGSPVTLDAVDSGGAVSPGSVTGGQWTGGSAATLNVVTSTIALAPAVGANLAPTADAGQAQTVEPWAAVSLIGSGSDSDGTIMGYTWRQVSGPAVTLSGSGATRVFTAPALEAGATLVFGLIVTDDGGATSGEKTVTVTVLGATEFIAQGTSWVALQTTAL